MLATPEFLTIGHVTRDLRRGGLYSPGGTAVFASVCAHRLGLTAGIATCADEKWGRFVWREYPFLTWHFVSSPQTTTFHNIYQDGFRTQYLHAQGSVLSLADIPASWLQSPLVLFGPVAQEIPLDLILSFPRFPGSLRAATPQGWLRHWDADGRVSPTLWLDAERILPKLDVLILSQDDLLPFVDSDVDEVESILCNWSMLVPLLVATDGCRGATLFQHGAGQKFPAFPAHEVDPTGAGDVFAAAFLTHLYRSHDPVQAVTFANCTAAFSVEQEGTAGIPTLQQVEQRLNG